MAWGDFFGTSWDDPKTMMMMQMAAGLLSGNPAGQNRATLGQSLGRGLLGGMQGYQQGMQMKRQGEMLDLKKREADLRDQQTQMELDKQRQAMAAQQQQREAQEKFWGLLNGRGLSPLDALSQGAQQGSVGPTRQNAALMNQPWNGQFTPEMLGLWQQGGGKAEDLTKYQQILRPDPMNVAAGNTLYDTRSGKPVFTAPNKPTELETLIARRDQFPQNSPNWKFFNDAIVKQTQHAPPSGMRMGEGGQMEWIPGYLEGRQRVAAAGATRNNISVNTEKNLFGAVADGVGKQVATAADQARAAVGQINTVHGLRGILDSGGIVAGPGAGPRTWMLRAGQVLGINGKDETELLERTGSAMQRMAQLELDAAQQMKGQGQITEAERAIISRAATGKIGEMTEPEIRMLLDTLEKTARFKIELHGQNFQAMQQNPSAGPLIPYLNVPMPPPYQPPARGNGAGGSAVTGTVAPAPSVIGIRRVR